MNKKLNIKTICPHCLYEYELETVKLHGEGKEAVHDHIPLRGLSIEEIKRNYPEQYAQAITEAEEFTDAQPDPWKAWVEEMPNPSLGTGINWTDWADRMKDWFRKMPRGK